MQHSPHVMMAGAGAEAFAKERGVEQVDPAYFRTERRWQQLQRALEEDATGQAHADPEVARHFGTVGALALDGEGHLAAGTSTGGMTDKRYGRIGDSPIIGAGPYANARCAVSGTGWGEFYIRDRTSVVEGKSVSVGVDVGGLACTQKKISPYLTPDNM